MTATQQEAVRAKRAAEAYQLLRWAKGLPPDPAIRVLMVPVKVKV